MDNVDDILEVARRLSVFQYESEYEIQGVYVISVAARLAEMHPNTLRKYESAGLISPGRTGGRQRMYSNDDIERLRIIRNLTDRYTLTVQGIRLALALIGLLKEIDADLSDNPSVAKLAAVKLVRDKIKAAIEGLSKA